MSPFLVRRLVRLAVVILGVSLVTFAILHASGDPVSLIMPEAPESDRAMLRKALGLHDPLPVQFARFVGNTVTGNFGTSFFDSDVWVRGRRQRWCSSGCRPPCC